MMPRPEPSARLTDTSSLCYPPSVDGGIFEEPFMSFTTVRRHLSAAIPVLTAALAISCGGSDTSTVNGGNGNGGPDGAGGTINLDTGGNGNLPGSGGGSATPITR